MTFWKKSNESGLNSRLAPLKCCDQKVVALNVKASFSMRIPVSDVSLFGPGSGGDSRRQNSSHVYSVRCLVTKLLKMRPISLQGAELTKCAHVVDFGHQIEAINFVRDAECVSVFFSSVVQTRIRCYKYIFCRFQQWRCHNIWSNIRMKYLLCICQLTFPRLLVYPDANAPWGAEYESDNLFSIQT